MTFWVWDVDPSEWLPLDTYLANFDNMANAQTLSAELLEAYLTAANEVSRLAVGHRNPASTSKTHTVSPYQSQHPWDYVEGAPYGTRAGSWWTSISRGWRVRFRDGVLGWGRGEVRGS